MAPRRSRRAAQRPQRFQTPAQQEASDAEHSQPLLGEDGSEDGNGEVSVPLEVLDGELATAREESEAVRRRRKRAGRGCTISLAEHNDRIAVMQQRIDILTLEVRFSILLCFILFCSNLICLAQTPHFTSCAGGQAGR